MKVPFSRKLVRLGLPVVVVLGMLLPMEILMTASSAGAATSASTTTSVSCTVHTLLLPGKSTSCSTPVENCPSPTTTFDTSALVGTGVADATVGVDIGGTVASVENGAYTVDGVTTTIPPITTLASCTKSLALLDGCTGQTAVTATNELGTGNFGGLQLTGSGQGVCIWTGGAVAVLVTLTCTETMTTTVVATD